MSKAFSAEVRAQACARVLAGERPTAVARDVGCGLETLRAWRRASGHAPPSHGREPDGRFRKGFTPNPGGCTTHAERAQRLLEEAAPKAAERLLTLANRILEEEDPEAVEVLATKGHVLHKLLGQILDRGVGKPQARIKVEADTPLDADRLAALRAKLSPPTSTPTTPTQGD